MKYKLNSLLLLAAMGLGGNALAATLQCPPSDYIGNAFLCEAYPQGPGHLYYWETTGFTFLPHKLSPENPFAVAGCYMGAGALHVTVVKPNGTWESASHNVPSCQNGWPY